MLRLNVKRARRHHSEAVADQRSTYERDVACRLLMAILTCLWALGRTHFSRQRWRLMQVWTLPWCFRYQVYPRVTQSCTRERTFCFFCCQQINIIILNTTVHFAWLVHPHLQHATLFCVCREQPCCEWKLQGCGQHWSYCSSQHSVCK